MVKLVLTAGLVLLSVVFGGVFLLVGLWSMLGFAIGALITSVVWRLRNGAGHFLVYLGGYTACLMLEAVLLFLVTSESWFGMHRIMDGYSAPTATQAGIALAPLVVYVGLLARWARRATQA